MVVTRTSRRPETFKANPNLVRPPLPSQCPTESRAFILPQPVLKGLYKIRANEFSKKKSIKFYIIINNGI